MDSDQWMDDMLVKPAPTGEGDAASVAYLEDQRGEGEESKPAMEGVEHNGGPEGDHVTLKQDPGQAEGLTSDQGATGEGQVLWEGGEAPQEGAQGELGQGAEGLTEGVEGAYQGEGEGVYYAEGGAEGLAGGEKLYAVVDGVAYEIVTGPDGQQMIVAGGEGVMLTEDQLGGVEGEGGQEGADQGYEGVATHAEGTISLEDLATISAEQATLKLEGGDAAGGDAGAMEYAQYATGGVEYSGGGGGGGVMVAAGGETIKLGDQDFVLQPGQQLPAELQDMIARGLPLDLSNYEFVIEGGGGTGAAAGGGGVQYVDEAGNVHFVDGAGAVQYVDGLQGAVLSAGGAGGVVNPNDVLSMLAEASVAQRDGQQQQRGGGGAGSRGGRAGSVQWQTGTQARKQPQQQGVYAVEQQRQQVQLGQAQQQQEQQRADQLQQQRQQLIATLFAADENCDGEFDHVSVTAALAGDDSAADSLAVAATPLEGAAAEPYNGFLASFQSFVRGGAQRGGAADPGTMRRPAVAPYTPGGRGSFMPPGLPRGGRGGTPRGGYTPRGPRGRPPKTASMGRGGAEQGGSGAYARSPLKESSIIQRKRKGSDTDSELEEEELVLAASGIVTTPSTANQAWRINAAGQATRVRLPNEGGTPVRGRGRPPGSPRGARGSASGTRGGHVPMTTVSASSQSAGYVVAYEPLSNKVTTIPASAPSVISKVAAPVITQGFGERTEAHSFQKGDFVVEWKDAYKTDGFPIWKIESGRLLQKFDAVLVDGGFQHKSASIYSSWSGDIRASFKAIEVELMTTTGRRQEVVRVLDKYLPRPVDDSLELDPLMELFNVYVQSLLSEAIEPNFLANVRSQNEEYYVQPLTQIDTLLEEAEKSALSLVNWNDKFKLYADTYPFYRFQALPLNEKSCCSAVAQGKLAAAQSVMFYGPTYDRDTVVAQDDLVALTIGNAEVHPVGQATVDHLPTYHALHHFKYLLHRKCRQEVQYRKQGKDKFGNIILEECLQNRQWVQQNLLNLKDLLQKCSIVVTVVTKTDDGI